MSLLLLEELGYNKKKINRLIEIYYEIRDKKKLKKKLV